ncbi:hypothetical protein CEUSTIGMA_g1931.t1 [Chlamydomonas eustigma]|uniref:Protein kinase domain-containing protein n=1 Tax=Chlamydomonas eustigma TaxID=1157962 RepID=A0A250WV31_9CHLO|nr:hypothetical protein CEUSTIGMA_g1931.t1 [Chlamydomonas eustigma]|eukprot:GAX74482.1 hypothetical protein CEUSTIGMA_g1931.t1 [Chlamydomonas eustigma]
MKEQSAIIKVRFQSTMGTRQQDVRDQELISRIEELETAIASALKVNKLLNQEVEKYVIASDREHGDCEAWMRRARGLAKQLHAARRRGAVHTGSGGRELNGNLGGDSEECHFYDGVEDGGCRALADYLDKLEAATDAEERDAAPSTSGLAIQPSPAQLRVIARLISRGKASGWLIEPTEVVLGKVLGQGCFGTTYLGRWRGADVAVKCVRVSKDTELTSFLREVEAMSLVRHPNVVPFLGACIQAPDQFWLLSEFMSGGTLETWLRPGGKDPLIPRPLAHRTRAALQVAQGMAALHGCQPLIMHRDLKPSNVFVDAGGAARIGDFGLVRRLLPEESKASLTGETGTYLYMAPEVMRHDVYDYKCDIWSWGVLFSETMDGGRLPYWYTYMTPVQIATAVAEEQLQPHIPTDLHADLQVLGNIACQFDPYTRPDFNMIVAELGPIVQQLEDELSMKSNSTILSHIQHLTAEWGGVLRKAIYGQKAMK